MNTFSSCTGCCIRGYDVAKGEIAFKKCVICHSIGPGAICSQRMSLTTAQQLH